MDERESILPLTLGAMLALMLHVAALGLALPIAQGQSMALSPVTTPPLSPPAPLEAVLPPPPAVAPPEPAQPEAEPEQEKPKPASVSEEPEPELPVTHVAQEIGRDDEPHRVTVAWIAYDDFQDLMARPSRTLQPALQRDVTPQPDAPINLNPAKPRPIYDTPQLAAGGPEDNPSPPQPAQQAMAQPPSADANVAHDEPSPQPAVPPSAPKVEMTDAPSPETPAQPDDRLALGPVVAPPQPRQPDDAPPDQPPDQPLAKPEPDHSPSSQPAPSSAPATQPASADHPGGASPAGPRGDQGTDPRTASLATQDSPTSVPLSDRESIPTQDTPSTGQIRLGRVLVSQGVEIKTIRPRFSIATIYTATPRNPDVRVLFDHTGQPIRAEILRTSGYADIDSPILNALYAWRATGKRIGAMQPGETFEWRGRILLVDEIEEP